MTVRSKVANKVDDKIDNDVDMWASDRVGDGARDDVLEKVWIEGPGWMSGQVWVQLVNRG
jgi:hypothetical protein